jgi:hypothetical protein
MPSNVYPSQGMETRLVRELTYGTTPGSPAWKRLNGFGTMVGATVETDPFAPPGALIPTIVLANDDFSEGSVDGRLDFNGLSYVLSGVFGAPVITSLGSGAYQHDWSWGGRRPNRPLSYSVYNGFPESANLVTGWLFNSLGISGGRSGGFTVSGDGFGKAMTAGQTMGGLTNEVQVFTKGGTWTAGTYTITIVETGQTTAAIAAAATAATIQTAIEAAIGSTGDIIVTGGPLTTQPSITLTYGGYFAGRNVAQATMDASSVTGSSPTITPSTTTPGADTVTDIAAEPAGATLASMYLDTTWAGLGGTQLLYPYNVAANFGARMGRVRPINKSKSSDGVIDTPDQDHNLVITFGRNAVSDAQLARLRASTRVFPRVEWVSATTSQAGRSRFPSASTPAPFTPASGNRPIPTAPARSNTRRAWSSTRPRRMPLRFGWSTSFLRSSATAPAVIWGGRQLT